MHTKLSLLATTAIAAVAIASPAEAGGLYLSIFGGANWADDASFTEATTPTANADTLTWDVGSETGFIVGGAVGLNLDQVVKGFRFEVEAAYRQESGDGIVTTNTGTPTAVSTGLIDFERSTFSVLANIWYEFDLAGTNPYFGGGAGWADTEIEGSYAGAVSGPFKFTDDGFAWQVGAGINFDISSNVVLGLDYRYFVGPEITIAAPTGNLTRADLDSGNHSATVSLKFGM
jgi:OmpA-OmpF porin, OOP family